MDHSGQSVAARCSQNDQSARFSRSSSKKIVTFARERKRERERERDGLTPRYIRSIYFLDSLLSSCPSLADAAAAVAAFSLHKSRHEGGTKKDSLVRASRAREYAPRAQLYDEHSRETRVAGDHDDEPVCRAQRRQGTDGKGGNGVGREERKRERKKRENTVAHLLRVLLFSLLLPFFLSFEDVRVDFAMSRRRIGCSSSSSSSCFVREEPYFELKDLFQRWQFDRFILYDIRKILL